MIQMNPYIGQNTCNSGVALTFDYASCTPDVYNMLRERHIPMKNLELKEEIGKGVVTSI